MRWFAVCVCLLVMAMVALCDASAKKGNKTMPEKRDLGSIYTAEWFEHDFTDLGPEFSLVARGIDRWSHQALSGGRRLPLSALDVGCGPGQLICELQMKGWDVDGFDGSSHALTMARKLGLGDDHMAIADILDTPEFSRADVVICTEVAEHLPAEHAPTLVRYLTQHATRYVVFTAAPPGQGGHDHVNEQPKHYWRNLFAQEGWIEDEDSTKELFWRWQCLQRLSHMRRNLMVYR